jgi:hypothetical protein
VITVNDTAPQGVAKKPESPHKNEPVKNIRQRVQDALKMPPDNNVLERDKNKK